MSAIRSSTRSTILQGKAVTINYTETTIPTAPDNFQDQYRQASRIATDLASSFTIDVLPNFIPIICQLMYYANLHSTVIDSTNHSMVSEPILAAYFLVLLYTHWLISDYVNRPVPSFAAQEFMNDNYKREFIEDMLKLPLPDFLEVILRRFTATTSSHRGNVHFVPSLAGYSFHHHFGRIVPINFFTSIHDLISKLGPRTTPTSALANLLNETLFTIDTFIHGRTDVEITIANYTSQAFTINNATSSTETRFRTLFNSLFQPVLIRDYQRRKRISPLNIVSPNYDANHNPYDFVFCASPFSLGQLRLAFQSLAPLVQKNIKCTGSLARIYDNPSGISILSHGYSKFALPTWHTSDTVVDEDDYPNEVASTDFARAIKFMQTPTPSYSVSHPFPDGTCTIGADHPVTLSNIQWPWLLLLNKERLQHQFPHPDNDFETYNESVHLAPNVYVIVPADDSSLEAPLVTQTGMVIESAELDGTIISIPNTDLGLGHDSSWFADSAIPLRYVYKATNFYDSNVRTSVLTRKRYLPPRPTLFSFGSMFVDRTKVILPRPMLQTQDNVADNTLPGLSLTQDVTWIAALRSFFGGRTYDPQSKRDQPDKAPGIKEDSILLFSPYTYVSYEGNVKGRHASQNDRIYYLSNLKTIFGSDHILISANNAYAAMPIF
jgi:hypothetical protein